MNKIFYCFILLLIPLLSYSQAIANNSYGYSIEPPAEWQAIPIENDNNLQFYAPNQQMALGIKVLPLSNYQSAAERFHDYTKNRAVLTEEINSFSYNDYPADLSYIQFEQDDLTYYSYLLWTTDGKYDFWLEFILPETLMDNNLAIVYSTLDSFALNDLERLKPGPISQFDYQVAKNTAEKATLTFNEQAVTFAFDTEQLGPAQTVVEREAQVMSRYSVQNELSFLAWIRYYRAVYRDNYSRLTPIYEALKPLLPLDDKVKTADLLLSLCQDYDYTRFITESDLLAPVAALIEKQSDCDSASLAYIILLNHAGIDSALFLSQTLAHAYTGVKVDKPGVTQRVFDDDFVGAELTTQHPLGVLPEDVVKTKDWLPILFYSPTNRL